MISINKIKIDQTFSNIEVNVNTIVGNNIESVLLWTSETFKDPTKAIDFSNKLTNIDNTEEFTISASELNLDKVTGLFFLEFTSNEEIEPNDSGNTNRSLGVVMNPIKYHECVLNKLLSIKIDGCKEVANDRCKDCDDNLFFIDTLLDNLSRTLKFGYYEEAIRIKKNLDDYCGICHSCPDLGDTLLVNGIGIFTLNNSITEE